MTSGGGEFGSGLGTPNAVGGPPREESGSAAPLAAAGAGDPGWGPVCLLFGSRVGRKRETRTETGSEIPGGGGRGRLMGPEHWGIVGLQGP